MSEDHRGEPGYCAFCGTGGGHLGDQGDESSMYLHSAVRSGEPGNWKYATHPVVFYAHPNNHLLSQQILWCGECEDGLAHCYQRYDDANLASFIEGYSLILKLDPIRWDMWSATTPEEIKEAQAKLDDVFIHGEKLRFRRQIDLMQQEQRRRSNQIKS